MKVLQVCAYAAPYEGNFMKSLYSLQKLLQEYGHETIYAFPESAANIPWCKELAKVNPVYYLPLEKARIRSKTYQSLMKIYRDHPEIVVVHSHFELYDLPLAIVTPKRMKLFWHLHDAITQASWSRELLRKLQYGLLSSRVRLISPSDHYRKQVVRLGFPEKQSETILNGIDLDRIHYCSDWKSKEIDFLAFVWLYHVKGCDVILDACEQLYKEGYRFKMMLIGAEDTRKEVSRRFPQEDSPIILGKAQEDINKLYRVCKVFISASRQETFSYSVCEAAYAGLPVISSRIKGLEWASELPTVSFFESQNALGLCTLMKQYLDGREVQKTDIEECRAVIEESYSSDCWAKKICQQYGIKY